MILAVTPAQAEVVKWAQNEEQVSLSLVLRSPDDFIDAERQPPDARITLPDDPAACNAPTPTTSPEPGASASPEPITPFPCEITPGVVLDTLIQQYGVLIVDIDGGVLGGSLPTPEPEADAGRVAGRVTGTVGDTRRRRQARRARRITIRPAPVGTPPIATHSSDP